MIAVTTEHVGFKREDRKEAIEALIKSFGGNADAALKSVKEGKVTFEETTDITEKMEEKLEIVCWNSVVTEKDEK